MYLIYTNILIIYKICKNSKYIEKIEIFSFINN